LRNTGTSPNRQPSGGGYLPVLRESQAGDFVYLKRRNFDNVLQMAAKRPVFRIKDIRDS